MKQQHYMGGRYPHGRELYQVYSREYYWAPAYRFFDNPYYGGDKWEEIHDGFGEVMPTSDTYRWESGEEYEKILCSSYS